MDLVLVAGGVALALALTSGRKGAPRDAARPKTAGPSTKTKPQGVRTVTLTRTLTRVVREGGAATRAPDTSAVLGKAALDTVAPALPGAAARTVSGVLSSAGERASFAGGPIGNTIGDALSRAGDFVSGLNAPLVGIFGSKLTGLRGASEAKQKAIFGQASVETAATGLSAVIPGIGAALGQLLKLGAGTGEGKRVVKAVGTAEEQVYVAQKKLFRGDIAGAFSGGGSDHKTRVRRMIAESTPETVQNNAALKAGDDAARKLAQDIAAGRGKPGDVSSLQGPNADAIRTAALNKAALIVRPYDLSPETAARNQAQTRAAITSAIAFSQETARDNLAAEMRANARRAGGGVGFYVPPEEEPS